MSLEQQDLDYRIKIDQNQKRIREMESYCDIAAGKVRTATNFLKNFIEGLKF